jgi:2-iminobutanoate/2-iminopropanoate deaminase
LATDVVFTEGAPAPGGAYSQGRLLQGLLFTAGMGPHDPITNHIVGTSIEEQAEQTIRNLESVLQAVGMSLADVIKTTVHLRDHGRDFAGFDATYRRLMPQPYPARTTVGSVIGEILIEMDFVAVRDVS